MIRINKDFVFEQTGENTFHLIRETYPRYESEMRIDFSIKQKYYDDIIVSDFITEKSDELHTAITVYGKSCLTEIAAGGHCERKILYAATNNDIERLERLSEAEQIAYFDNLVGYFIKGQGLVIKPIQNA